MASLVSSIPRLRTTMYVGIIPRLNIMVKVINNAMGLDHMSFLDSPYPASTVRVRPKAVPVIRYIMVLP